MMKNGDKVSEEQVPSREQDQVTVWNMTFTVQQTGSWFHQMLQCPHKLSGNPPNHISMVIIGMRGTRDSTRSTLATPTLMKRQ